MSLIRAEPGPFDLLRPFVWLAVIAFFLGFATYMLAGAGSAAEASSRSQASTPLASSMIDWNTRQAI